MRVDKLVVERVENGNIDRILTLQHGYESTTYMYRYEVIERERLSDELRSDS